MQPAAAAAAAAAFFEGIIVVIMLVINLMQKFLFYNKFIICLYMFRALCALHQEVKLYHTASGIISPLPTCAPDGHLQSVTIPDAV